CSSDLTTLPKVTRSGAHAGAPTVAPAASCSSPHQPAAPTRKPVSTSSTTSSAPCCRVTSRRNALNPGSGGTTPMFAGAASVMTAATSSPRVANTSRTAATSLYGTTTVCAAVAAVTPAEPGSPKVATPEPAAVSSASTC